MSPSRWLAPLCLVSVLWAFSFGVNAPLASLWLQGAGYSDTLIGQNTGTYYLGIALASAVVPWGLRNFGGWVLLVGLLASALTAGAFPWGDGLPGWFLLRGLNGAAAALSLVPLETLVNRTSSQEQRARNFGYYAFSIALGMALGNLVALQMAPWHPRLAFVLGGLGALLGVVLLPGWRPVFPADAEVRQYVPLRPGRNFLAFGSGWAQGFMEGGMVAHLPIYLLAVGLSHSAVSFLMGGLMIGVILAQVPVAWGADRIGRAIVLFGCNVLALVGIGCLLWTGSAVWLGFWLFVVGACSGAFYPLGLALLGERTPPAGMSRVGAWFLAVNCLGSLVGPVAAGAAMDRFGTGTLFVVGAGAIVLVLFGWCLTAGFAWLTERPAIGEPLSQQGEQLCLPRPVRSAA